MSDWISHRPQALPAFARTPIFPWQPTQTAMKRTVSSIFCEEASFAGGAAGQENCRFNTLFQLPWLKNGFTFALHDASQAAMSAREHAMAYSSAHRPQNLESLFGKHNARIHRVRGSFVRPKGRTALYGCFELLDQLSCKQSGRWLAGNV